MLLGAPGRPPSAREPAPVAAPGSSRPPLDSAPSPNTHSGRAWAVLACTRLNLGAALVHEQVEPCCAWILQLAVVRLRAQAGAPCSSSIRLLWQAPCTATPLLSCPLHWPLADPGTLGRVQGGLACKQARAELAAASVWRVLPSAVWPLGASSMALLDPAMPPASDQQPASVPPAGSAVQDAAAGLLQQPAAQNQDQAPVHTQVPAQAVGAGLPASAGAAGLRLGGQAVPGLSTSASSLMPTQAKAAGQPPANSLLPASLAGDMRSRSVSLPGGATDASIPELAALVDEVAGLHTAQVRPAGRSRRPLTHAKRLTILQCCGCRSALVLQLLSAAAG